MLLTNFTVFAAPKANYKIVTSTTPIASLVAMLVKDKVEVSSLASTNSCPHHYHGKPSDLTKVKNADITIYINEKFDRFAAKLMLEHSKQPIKISDFKSLKLIENDNYHINWHLWLDLANVNILLEELSTLLARQLPELSSFIYYNLITAKLQVEDLAKIKAAKIAHLSEVILLNDSLEYFFLSINYPQLKLHNSEHKSLKYINTLRQLLVTAKNKCLVIDAEQNVKLYQNFDAKIIQLESENWLVVDGKKLSDLFYTKYLAMIDIVATCK